MSEKCAVCGGKATQIHHLGYDPEIAIHLCVPCHVKVHEHGVGRGKGEQLKPIAPKHEERELILPMFTTKKEIDGTTYITSKKGEILNNLVCPNCEGKGMWEVFGDKNRRTFLRCVMCGVDYEIKVLPRTG